MLIRPSPFPRTFDGVVGTTGRVDFTVLQDADDELDAAAYALYVKQGTYSAGLTVSTNNVYIFFEPGTVVQAAMEFSGTGITVVLGAQCDVQGLITLSGANCSLICQGGCDLDGILVSGATCLVDGGGWDTLSNGGTTVIALSVTGVDAICRDIATQTTAGAGNSFEAVNISAVRCSVVRVKVIDSDGESMSCGGASDDLLIQDCLVLGGDDAGLELSGERSRIIGNTVKAAGAIGISLAGAADDSVVIGNIVQDSGGDPINIAAANENCVVVGNRTDGAIVDDSGTSTVASNDATAF